MVERAFVDSIKRRGGTVERGHGRGLEGAVGDVLHTLGDAIGLDRRAFIEGILVGRKYENDNKVLKEIKDLIPNVYICNLDGKVIIGNK